MKTTGDDKKSGTISTNMPLIDPQDGKHEFLQLQQAYRFCVRPVHKFAHAFTTCEPQICCRGKNCELSSVILTRNNPSQSISNPNSKRDENLGGGFTMIHWFSYTQCSALQVVTQQSIISVEWTKTHYRNRLQLTSLTSIPQTSLFMDPIYP